MLQGLAIFVGSVATILYLVHYLMRGGRRGHLIDKIPGPYAWPIIGNAPKFLGPLDQIWNLLRDLNCKYHGIYRLWMGPDPVVMLADPEDLEALLSSSKHIKKSLYYKFAHPWLGTGLVTSNGEKWHQRRKILTPALHFSVLQQFVGIFIEQGDKLAESLCPDGEAVVDDLVSLIQKYTLSSICDHRHPTTFAEKWSPRRSRKFVIISGDGNARLIVTTDLLYIGTSPHAGCRIVGEQTRLAELTSKDSAESAMGYASSKNDEVLNEYTSCVQEMGDLLTYRATKPWLYFDWSFRWTQKFVEQCRVLNVLHGFSTNMIRERQQYHADTDGQYLKGLDNDEGIYGYDDHHANGKRRLAMLDLLISASQQDGRIDDEGIREEVDTFVFAGTDTTSTALSFALLLLAENKEIQDKARAEIDEVFGERRGEKMSIRDIQGLGYLERCLKESFRLFPPVPLISRRISEDLQLKNYVVPGGTTTAALIYDVHRDPNFWPNPTVFDPDRFLPERTQGRHPFAYIPFSAGPRNCIGQKFAMLELKAFLGKILHKFFVEPITLTSELRLVPDMVLKPLTPVRIRLVRRS